MISLYFLSSLSPIATPLKNKIQIIFNTFIELLHKIPFAFQVRAFKKLKAVMGSSLDGVEWLTNGWVAIKKHFVWDFIASYNKFCAYDMICVF